MNINRNSVIENNLSRAFCFNAFVVNLDVFVRARARIAAGVLVAGFEDAASLAVAIGLDFVEEVNNRSGSIANRRSAAIAFADVS